MKRDQQIHLFTALLVSAGMVATPLLAATTNTSPAKGAASKVAPAPAPVEIPIPQSDFTIPKSRDEGIDPFFPLSRRLTVNPNPAKTNKTTVRAELAVKGFSASAGKPLVIINDITFGVGDRREVNTPQGRMTVTCISISLEEKTATIEVSGERRELGFRVGK